ncbi:tRNA (adenosine(37)-N6)-dimethylallyltransferase MiaA [soil metagenome]
MRLTQTCPSTETVDTTVPVLIGATGVGKTAVSLALAEHLGAEIISVDSRQIYREISVGTAKPEAQERARVPHHFLDERSLRESVSAGQFAQEALTRISEIHARGRAVVAVGGSTLYLEALVHGIAETPEPDPAMRDRLNEQASTPEGRAALHLHLTNVDPVTSASIDRSNGQRLARALEVFLLTGKPFSSFAPQARDLPYDFRVFVLDRPREELYARIDERVDVMVETGLFEEVKALLDAGFSPDLYALRTIGYREVIEHLSGKPDRERAISLIKRNSRRYAKRQLTWFRRYPDYEWMDISGQSPGETATNIADDISSRSS